MWSADCMLLAQSEPFNSVQSDNGETVGAGVKVALQYHQILKGCHVRNNNQLGLAVTTHHTQLLQLQPSNSSLAQESSWFDAIWTSQDAPRQWDWSSHVECTGGGVVSGITDAAKTRLGWVAKSRKRINHEKIRTSLIDVATCVRLCRQRVTCVRGTEGK